MFRVMVRPRVGGGAHLPTNKTNGTPPSRVALCASSAAPLLLVSDAQRRHGFEENLERHVERRE